MKNRLLFTFVVSLLIALVVASVVGAAPKDGPVVSLSVTQGSFAASEDVQVTVTIFNPHRHTIRVLNWFTPESESTEPLFAVTRNGQPVAYTGPIYKRAAATGNDYISLRSGASLVSAVNLGESYDLSADGQYEVAFAVAAFNLFNERGNAFQYKDVLVSEKISVNVAGRQPTAKPTTPTPPPPGGNAYNACSTDQQTLLTAARNQSKIYASNAENYLLGNNQGLRYTTWFGVFSSTRYNTVKGNFTAISNAMDNAGIIFDCKCRQRNTYAYVYPNQPYNIYLCGAFWAAPLSGTDSKAGTLIHEMSHFNVVAGTDDVVYGQTGAMNLASSDPNLAVTNADNHEYFAENTPSLP